MNYLDCGGSNLPRQFSNEPKILFLLQAERSFHFRFLCAPLKKEKKRKKNHGGQPTQFTGLVCSFRASRVSAEKKHREEKCE